MAAMDTRLPLMAQAPNMLGSFVQGVSARSQVDEMRRQQAEQQFLGEQGTALYQGDPNALAQYAQFNPQAAMELRGYHESREQARQSAARSATSAAAKLSAAEAKAEHERLTSVIEGASLAQDEESYNSFLVSQNIDPAQYAFADRDMNLAMLSGAAEALEIRAAQQPEVPDVPAAFEALQLRAQASGLQEGTPEYEAFMASGGAQPTFRPATSEEAAGYGAVAGQIDDETGRFYPAPTPTGMKITTTPEGGFTYETGAGVGGEPADEMDKPPKGWVRETDEETGDTRLVPEKGGPAWNDIVDESQKVRGSLDSFQASNALVDEEINLALKVLEDETIPTSGLIGELTKAIPGTPAHALQQRLLTINTNTAFDFLAEMRRNSKTGGAVGQLSDSEREAMSAIHGSLEQSNRKEDLIYNLRRLQDVRANAGERLVSAYNEDYKQVGVTFGADITAPTVKEIQSMTKDQLMDVTAVDMDAMSTEELTAFVEASRAAAGLK